MLLLDLQPGNEQHNRLVFMQSQIDDAVESMGKVRRKVFAEVTAVRKKLTELETENEYLRQALKEASHGTSNPYEQEGYFPNVFKYREE